MTWILKTFGSGNDQMRPTPASNAWRDMRRSPLAKRAKPRLRDLRAGVSQWRPQEYFRTAIGSEWVSDLSALSALPSILSRYRAGRPMAGVSAVSASVMPISRPGAGRPLPGSCNSRNFRKRYANGQRLGMAGSGRRIAQARIVATGNSFAPHRGPEIDLRRGRLQCLRAMALREIIEASEHDAGPVEVGLGRHTPQHCSGTSRIGRARWLHFGRTR